MIAVSLLLTLVYLPLNKTLLHLLGMQGQLEIYGLQYMRVITAGILFQVLGVGLVPLIRQYGEVAAGDGGDDRRLSHEYCSGLSLGLDPAVWSAGRGGGHGAGAGGNGALVRRGLVSCPESFKSPMG